MRKWWQYFFPRYGNWGAPGWSGGEWVNDSSLTKWWVEPIDAMDALFKEHDYAYQKQNMDIVVADLRLVYSLIALNVEGLYANAYRLGAIWIFYFRARFIQLFKYIKGIF